MSGDNNVDTDLIPGIEGKEIGAFIKPLYQKVLAAVKAANDLPVGDDYDYYKTYATFQKEMQKHRDAILMQTESVLSGYVKGEVVSSGKGMMDVQAGDDETKLENRFDAVQESLDGLFERVATTIDRDIKGLRMKPKIGELTASEQEAQLVTTKWDKNGKKPVHMVHALNIIRPQIHFSEKVDNSRTPFVPKITEKRNAIVPLAKVYEDFRNEAKRTTTSEPDSALENAALSDHVSRVLGLSSQPTSRSGSAITSGTATPTQQPTRTQESGPMEVDGEAKEAMKPYTDASETLRPNHIREEGLEMGYPHPYGPELAAFEPSDEMIVVEEAQIYRPLEETPLTMVDTPQGLKDLVITLNGCTEFAIDLEAHQYRTFDGIVCLMQPLFLPNHRPIPAEMLHYARGDTHYLLYIYDRMRIELGKRSRQTYNLTRATWNRSTEVARKRFEKTLWSEDSYAQLLRKYNRTLGDTENSIFKAVFDWRDSVAREEDESPAYVLPVSSLFAIATAKPVGAASVMDACRPLPPLVRVYAQELAVLIREAVKNPMSINAAPQPAEQSFGVSSALYSVIQDHRKKRGGRLALLNTAGIAPPPRAISLEERVNRCDNVTAAHTSATTTTKASRIASAFVAHGANAKNVKAKKNAQSKAKKAVASKVDNIIASFKDPFAVYVPDGSGDDIPVEITISDTTNDGTSGDSEVRVAMPTKAEARVAAGNEALTQDVISVGNYSLNPKKKEKGPQEMKVSGSTKKPWNRKKAELLNQQKVNQNDKPGAGLATQAQGSVKYIDVDATDGSQGGADTSGQAASTHQQQQQHGDGMVLSAMPGGSRRKKKLNKAAKKALASNDSESLAVSKRSADEAGIAAAQGNGKGKKAKKSNTPTLTNRSPTVSNGEFVPFDYSGQSSQADALPGAEDSTMINGKRQRPKKHEKRKFDPYSQIQDPEFKKDNRITLNPKSGQRSMTYKYDANKKK
ncbi:hypothetical protein, variant [Sphaeroforma arctica JP610]|uniref:HRDC domain-containing protein n=1 Tax=Sphaeroforma arctica JP610 TaxID=667725 RepID=A0A0L0FW62_9EUKA|nr:hypothetical protein, variant [Sphaeroforma arctica JP610]KNC80183.1 hypothetical protein, variant [Sphaeroforma arctica JP610]|eukprot:XP_014154085.1 hypothetical protein, variant [Sphaeroforma arctica JP610]